MVPKKGTFIPDSANRLSSQLLHCIDRLNRLPISVKYLQETRIGRTVNNLREYNGVVGDAATALVTKWKRKVEVDSVESSGRDERLHSDDTENVEPFTRKNYTVSHENSTNSTPNSDSHSQDLTVNKNLPISGSTDSTSGKSQEKPIQLEYKISKNCDEKMSKSHRSSSSISRSTDQWNRESSVRSDYRDKTKDLKRKECGKTNGKKERRESVLIDIDSTMGTSFGEALGMLDMPLTSKAKKLRNSSSSSSKTSISSEQKRSGISSPSDEIPMLLIKRPKLEPLLDISVEALLPCTITQPKTLEHASRQTRKATTQLTDQETINYCTSSRKTKTKVFSGNKAESHCKVPTLFEMSMHILQSNIDCEYSYIESVNSSFTNSLSFFVSSTGVHWRCSIRHFASGVRTNHL